MKILFVSIFLLFSLSVYSQVDKNGKFNGKSVYGDVEIITGYATFDVYISSSDCLDCYEIEIVKYYPSENQWKVVDYYGDFTVKIVSSEYHADFKVYIKSNKYKSAFMDKYVY